MEKSSEHSRAARYISINECLHGILASYDLASYNSLQLVFSRLVFRGRVPLRDLELLLVEAFWHLLSKIYIRCVAWPCSACETQRKAGEGCTEAPRLFYHLSRPFAVLACPQRHILSDIDIVVVASCSLNQAHYPNLHMSGHVLWGQYN